MVHRWTLKYFWWNGLYNAKHRFRIGTIWFTHFPINSLQSQTVTICHGLRSFLLELSLCLSLRQYAPESVLPDRMLQISTTLNHHLFWCQILRIFWLLKTTITWFLSFGFSIFNPLFPKYSSPTLYGLSNPSAITLSTRVGNFTQVGLQELTAWLNHRLLRLSALPAGKTQHSLFQPIAQY